MLVNNFRTAIAMGRGAPFNGVFDSGSDASLSSDRDNANIYYSTYSRGFWVDVGFGDTPETKEDYKLAISNASDTPELDFVSSMTAYMSPYIKTATTMYINNKDYSVTVKEVALCRKTVNGNSTEEGWYDARNMIYARTVLDEPIIVNPGKTQAFTYDISLNFEEEVVTSEPETGSESGGE